MRLEEASKERFIKKIWSSLEAASDDVMGMTEYETESLPEVDAIIKWVDSGAADSFLQKKDFNWQNFAAGKDDKEGIPLYVHLLNAYFDYKKAGGSRKEKKRIMKEDPISVFEKNGWGLKVVHEGDDVTGADMVIMDSFENDNWIFVVPMNHEACIFMDSFDCGGQGAKWCIGTEGNSEPWEHYTRKLYEWFVMAFNKDPFCEENDKKYMLQLQPGLKLWNLDTLDSRNNDWLTVHIWNQEDNRTDKGLFRDELEDVLMQKFGFPFYTFLKAFYKNILQKGESEYLTYGPLDQAMLLWKTIKGTLTPQDVADVERFMMLWEEQVPLNSVEELQDRIMMMLRCASEAGRTDLALCIQGYNFEDDDLNLDLADFNFDEALEKEGYVLFFSECDFNCVNIVVPNAAYVKKETYLNFDFTKLEINGANLTDVYSRGLCCTIAEFLDNIILKGKDKERELVKKHRKVIEERLCEALRVGVDEVLREYKISRTFDKVIKSLDESKKQNRRGMIWDFDSKLNEKKTVHVEFADDNEAEEFRSEMKSRFNYPTAKSKYAVVSGRGRTGKAVYVENKLKEEVYIAEPEQPMQMYIVKEDHPDVFYAYIVSKKKRYGTLLNSFVSKYGYKVVFSKPEMCAYAKGMPTREANNDIYIEQQVDKYNLQLLDALREFLKAAKINNLQRVNRRTIEIPEEVGFLNKQLKRRKFQESEAKALSQKDICFDLSDIIRDIMEGFDNSVSNIHLYKGVKVDYWGTKVAWISGGLNGSGEWSDYLNDLADFIVELEDRLHTSYAKNSHVNVVDVITDPADDVFDVLISITVGESFDETESLEWLEKNHADSIDDIDFEWDEEVADWIFYDHAHLKLS